MSTCAASETGLPLSLASASASIAALDWMASANRSKHAARSEAGFVTKRGKARFAARIASSTSALPERGMVPYTWPVPGATFSKTSGVDPRPIDKIPNLEHARKLPPLDYLCSAFGVFAPWCNGNTPVFGTVFPGSSPGGATEQSTKPPPQRWLFLCPNAKARHQRERDGVNRKSVRTNCPSWGPK